METKKNFCLCFLLACLAVVSNAQSAPILVVGPVPIDTHINNAALSETVRAAIVSAFSDCSDISVQLDHQYRANTPVAKIRQMKEVEEMIIANYTEHKGLSQLDPTSKKKIEDFRSNISTTFLAFGNLSQNPLITNSEYRLTVHVIGVSEWNYVFITEAIEFNKQDIQNENRIRKKVLQAIQEKGKSKQFCIPTGQPKEQKMDKKKGLDSEIQKLALLAWFYPNDSTIRKAVIEYTDTQETKEHYLHQKLIALMKLLHDYQWKEAVPVNMSIDVAEELIIILEKLIGYSKEPMQKEDLKAKRDWYRSFIKEKKP